MPRIFILSPARTGGERAKLIYNPNAGFDLARRLRSEAGVPLGEAFSFLSGLYFRGKYTYSRVFVKAPAKIPGILVITPGRGLLPVETPVKVDDLQAFAEIPVDPKEPRYLQPLERDCALLAEVIGPRCDVVFLGSIGTNKYADVLLQFFGKRLQFPPAFVGRGDMSRGGLLLRHAAAKEELEYIPVAGAVRKGKRPEKLAPKKWGYRIESGVTALDGKTEN